MMTYCAHSKNRQGQEQPLKEHLSEVARLAGEFAGVFEAGEEAELAGLLHDIGKYSERFRDRLDGKETGLDHWSPGAWIALGRPHQSIAAALAIQGHHIGLQKGDRASLGAMDLKRLAEAHPLNLRLTETAPDVLMQRLTAEGLAVPSVGQRLCPTLQVSAAAMLDVRMLFSALVDADFLDTERHFREARRPGLALQPERAFELVERHVTDLGRTSSTSPTVQALRDDLWSACLEASQGPPGLYTLSAPTGAGKTLAMLGFALRHAVHHLPSDPTKPPRFRRVVVVVPYLSIIDQTVKVYQKLFEKEFGPEYVLEHHSLAGTRTEGAPEGGAHADAESETRRRARLLAENWDAPLIVTTSVQFLESLFANRPSACRKLHRLANSIILFDEVQTLPLPLAIPTLATLSWLSHRYGATVLFATATQPAFSHLDEHVRGLGGSGWQPSEIAGPTLHLFGRTRQERRTRVEWPAPGEYLPWEMLAEHLAAAEPTVDDQGRQWPPQHLCIVNLKRHAEALFKTLAQRQVPNLRHLSTSMCPAHRAAVLDELKQWLEPENPQPCCLIATQCIEAGVDVDFGTVYRALAPLDAISQAAGRCNRHGRRPEGRVIVFHPEQEEKRLYPSEAYAQATLVTKSLLARYGAEGMDLYDPELCLEYYRELYDIARPETQREELLTAIRNQDFPEVARLYRLIEKDAVNLLVLYKPAQDKVRELAEEVRDTGLTSAWIQRARPYTVSIYRPSPDTLRSGYFEPVPLRGREGKGDAQDWFLCLDPNCYNDHLGLTLPEGLRSLIT